KDFTSRRDFASLEGGGHVLPGLTTPPSKYQDGYWPFLRSPKNNPSIALSKSLEMNACWCFRGSSGQLGIALAEVLLITHVTLDHIPEDFTSNINLAPRDIIFWGVINGEENSHKVQSLIDASEIPPGAPAYAGGLSFIELAHIHYDIHSTQYIQTFPISQIIRNAGIHFGLVVAEFLGNWGGGSTCVYRVRVHGEPVP
ncbi:hypothetical protein F4604DRAFT_1575706, partial [Suillus subluteus]